MNNAITLFFKGLAIGAANVIPGVSGGTIALITGIYDKLINSIKSVDATAFKLFFQGKFKEFWAHVNGTFLLMIFLGIGVSIVSLAKIFKWMLENDNPSYEIWLYAFFFGLILVSIISVGRTVEKWNIGTIISIVVGLALALFITFLKPGVENEAIYYLMICGAIAMCSMILPGLSGSFVLIILGNYKLIMVDAISDFNTKIIIPVGIGAVLGLLAFSRVLSWVFKNYKDQTIALMTGFIVGSLAIIWPWKDKKFLQNEETGEFIMKKGEKILSGYENWHLPDFTSSETLIAIALIIGGGIAIWAMEKFASDQSEESAA
ncbi:MAG: DUF368 domain-containing protein [Bacteroidia bacterium]|nr:DUF368 domain-containing protein [Bacteroidia bacterium]